MNVADLIRELSKLPGHLPVAVGLDGEIQFADELGEHTLKLCGGYDAYGLTDVVFEGRVVRLVGAGMHWATI